MKLLKTLRKLILKLLRVKPETVMEEAHEVPTDLPQQVLWQTTLLAHDELLVYTAEDGTVHYVTTSPYDPNKQYRVLLLNYSDL